MLPFPNASTVPTMPMATPTTEQLLTAIRQSELVDSADLSAVIREFHQHGNDSDAKQLGDFLIKHGLLTSWQLDKLKAGRTRGFHLGKYRLLSHVGRGGMGSVYRALHVGLNRQVALKVLPTELVHDKTYLERFQREARVVASLDHPHIVRAYDFDQAGDLYYLVMEFVDGQDLAAIVKQRHPLPIAQVVQWTRQAAEGLQHAHDRQIIHRDVKPSNLLVDEQGNVKVLDLGLARWHGSDKSSISLVHDERILGTADYLSPEQAIDSRSVDARGDIYSLGCTLYYALTGHPPFHEGTIAQRIAHHLQSPPPPLRPSRQDAPSGLESVVLRMMAKRPDDRYATMAEVAIALAGVVSEPANAENNKDEFATIAKTFDTAWARSSRDGKANEPMDLQLPAAVTESEPLRARIRRPVRSKRPPIWLWLILFILSAILTALLLALHRRGF